MRTLRCANDVGKAQKGGLHEASHHGRGIGEGSTKWTAVRATWPLRDSSSPCECRVHALIALRVSKRLYTTEAWACKA